VGVVLQFQQRPKPPKQIDPGKFRIGDPIKASPVGSGEITGVTDAGYPQVNRIAVAWMIRTDGAVFDPHGHVRKPDFNEEHWYDIP
jgi:hypothetical protein